MPISNSRQLTIKDAHDSLKEGYKRHTGKELSYSHLAFKLSHLKEDEIRYVMSVAKQSDNYAKTFWGQLKVKNA